MVALKSNRCTQQVISAVHEKRTGNWLSSFYWMRLTPLMNRLISSFPKKIWIDIKNDNSLYSLSGLFVWFLKTGIFFTSMWTDKYLCELQVVPFGSIFWIVPKNTTTSLCIPLSIQVKAWTIVEPPPRFWISRAMVARIVIIWINGRESSAKQIIGAWLRCYPHKIKKVTPSKKSANNPLPR